MYALDSGENFNSNPMSNNVNEYDKKQALRNFYYQMKFCLESSNLDDWNLLLKLYKSHKINGIIFPPDISMLLEYSDDNHQVIDECMQRAFTITILVNNLLLRSPN